MNAIEKCLRDVVARGEKALIPFITAGDPTPELTVMILLELQAAGADVIELGVPYSDPLADGPVIQRASLRALKHNITIKDCLDIVDQARAAGLNVPVILFGYYNPALQMGLANYFAALRDHDIAGTILPDLPMEECEEALQEADRHGVALIPLAAPTSKQRVREIASIARGFVYCVSSLGVTGERVDFHKGLEQFITTVREATDLPVAIGFGVATRAQALELSEFADAIVVGSAIVRTIEEIEFVLSQDMLREKGLLHIREFVRQLKP